jgi:cytochrome c
MNPGVTVALGVVALLVPFAASAAGDSEQGRAIAETWCASCHAVERTPVATDIAPPFSTIMERPDVTPDRLRAWLADPHPPMPNLDLTRQEIEDLVAYLQGSN